MNKRLAANSFGASFSSQGLTFLIQFQAILHTDYLADEEKQVENTTTLKLLSHTGLHSGILYIPVFADRGGNMTIVSIIVIDYVTLCHKMRF